MSSFLEASKVFGGFICAIKVSHGRNSTANEVVAISVKKTEKAFKGHGLP
jgi:hypothetical protein